MGMGRRWFLFSTDAKYLRRYLSYVNIAPVDHLSFSSAVSTLFPKLPVDVASTVASYIASKVLGSSFEGGVGGGGGEGWGVVGGMKILMRCNQITAGPPSVHAGHS